MSEEKIEEDEYFNAHYEEFLDKYEGLVLVIKDKKVVERDEDLEKVLEARDIPTFLYKSIIKFV
jgi:hypothetical protein